MSSPVSALDVRERILHVFSIYPKISPSMLQISLNLPAKDWRPVLEELITEDQVTRQSLVHLTPTGRNQSYTILTSNILTAEVETVNDVSK